MRDNHVVIQKFEYSCGSSALGTLMRYYFGDSVEEIDLVKDILSKMTKQQIEDRQKNGLSVLDLKQAAQRRGYQAVGVKLPLETLPRLKGPILVYLENDEYRHFTIFKGVREDRVYLADPSRGNVRLSIDKFAKQWNGIALILGKNGFGLPSDHLLAVTEEPPVRHELRTARQALFKRP